MSSEFSNVQRKSAATASRLPEWVNAHGGSAGAAERKAARSTQRFMLIGLVLLAAIGIATAAVLFMPEPDMPPPEGPLEGLVDPSKAQGNPPHLLPTLDLAREPTGPLSIGDVIKRVEHGV